MPTPEEIRQSNEKIPKKGGKLDKYKWWLVGGLAVIAVAVFYFTSQSNQNAQSSTTGTQPGIDPNTGLPYSQETGMGGMGMGGFPFMFGGGGGGGRGLRGPAGPPGKRGPRGKRGPGGKHHKHHHHKHHHHHHHDGNGNGSSMSNLGALRAFGGSKMSAPARAAHNRRIVPAGMSNGPGLR